MMDLKKEILNYCNEIRHDNLDIHTNFIYQKRIDSELETTEKIWVYKKNTMAQIHKKDKHYVVRVYPDFYPEKYNDLQDAMKFIIYNITSERIQKRSAKGWRF